MATLTTTRPLLARATDPDILRTAWERVRAKGARGGIDQVSVEEFVTDSEARLDELRRELLEERYVPEPLKQIAIPKAPGKEGMRLLGLPTVRDKIAQEAVRSAIEPLIERLFLDCSYGYRPGKGPHRAIARVTHYLINEKRRWIASADIDDFFGSLDHAKLLNQLRPVLQDEAVLRLIELWLKIGTVDPRGRWHDVFSGVGQGGIISPLLANFYLHPFDQSMTAQQFGLVRYADDFVILCADRSQAEDALVKATEFLKGRLSLRLNLNPQPIVPIEQGFAFLGILFRQTQRFVDRRKLDQIAAKVAHLTDFDSAQEMAHTIHRLNEAIAGWRRYYGRVVEPTEAEKIERLTHEGLIRLLTTAYTRKTLQTQTDGESALQHLELLRDRSSQDRQAIIADLVRAARFGRGQTPRADAQKGVSPRLEADRPTSPPTITTQVRRKKRQHLRQFAQVSELVVTTPGCFLGKSRGRVVVRRQRTPICEIPEHHLTGITVATHGIALSADVIALCAERDIPLLFLTPHGKVTALLSAPESFKGAIGVLQLEALAKGTPALDLAKRFVQGKITNQMNLMKYLHKYRKRTGGAFAQAFSEHLNTMARLRDDVGGITLAESYDTARNQLFSVEGRAAQHYWDLIGRLLAEHGNVTFPGRERKGAPDLVNSLLNYGYALLHNRVYLALLKAGLLPQISFLHTLQKDKPALVYDLMEEFRPQVVDRSVLTMLARHEPVAIDERGLLSEETRKRLITQVHDRLATLIRFRGRELKLDEVIQHQADLLVRHLKGDGQYRPFVGKW